MQQAASACSSARLTSIMLHLLFLNVPAALRRDSHLFWLAVGVFTLSVILAFVLAQLHVESVNLIYNAQQIAEFMRMFHPHWQALLIEQRSTTEHFIFYVMNNSWVGIQLFLLGILVGVGSFIFLAYIGFSLGLMLGYLSLMGYGDVMWPSILAHSAFEITATIMAAVAGSKWGLSLVLIFNPVRRHEFGLRFAQSLVLLLNAMVFFVMAALIESYWSFGVQTTVQTKYMVGGLSWAGLIIFLLFFGRVTKKHENS